MALTDRDGGASAATTQQAPPSAAPTEDPLRLWLPDPLSSDLVVHAVSPDSELGDQAERFAYETYREQGYCRDSPRHWIEEVEPWRARSTLHVATEGGEVLGVLRTILGQFSDLPVSQFEPTIDMENKLLLDGGSLAVKSDYRGLGLATELYRHWVERGVRNRALGFCIVMDDGLVDVLETFFALPTHPFAERRHYMGGDIVPRVVWLDEMMEALARHRPLLYGYAVSGFSPAEIAEFDLPIVLS